MQAFQQLSILTRTMLHRFAGIESASVDQLLEVGFHLSSSASAAVDQLSEVDFHVIGDFGGNGVPDDDASKGKGAGTSGHVIRVTLRQRHHSLRTAVNDIGR